MLLSGSAPVAVIGAGPIGLAAAARLAASQTPFVLLEAGPRAAASVAAWSHVRMFSPWSEVVDEIAAAALRDSGWIEPDRKELPTGGELVARYLQPLAELPQLAPRIRYDARVVSVSRSPQGFDLELATGEVVNASLVLDCSGTFATPVPPPAGARELADRVGGAVPDVLGADRERFADRHTAVVGAGHSAAQALLALVALRAAHPSTRATWVLRRADAARLKPDGDDAVSARVALERRLEAAVDAADIDVVRGFAIGSMRADGDGVAMVAADGGELVADRVVLATGFAPDLRMLDALALDLDPVLECPRLLAPIIDPTIHTCGTVARHGAEVLRHPEPGLWVLGMKSYGRAPSFLLSTGYGQLDSVLAQSSTHRPVPAGTLVP